MQAQVAVAGGGPVGMLVAAELAGYGVDVVVFETRADVSERPKATTLHARAVQCLARRGHLPPAAADGPGGAAAGDFHFAGLPGLAIAVPPTEPVAILKTSQAQLERHFEARARAAGARVLRGHRVTGTEQDREGVRLKVEGSDGTTVCEARYLVGADGARSTVREQAGIVSDTSPATVSALTGLVTLEEPEALPGGFLRTPRGWIVSKYQPGRGTSIRTLDCRAPAGDRHLPVSPEEFRLEVSRIAGRDVAMGQPRWLGRFSDYTRLARTFREGRVFLVGDAAHVHFPIGGQGLSAGVLDALCLGWKLALAVRGEAGPALLDSYDPERRTAARRVVENTRAQLTLMRPGSEVDALRSVFAGVVAADRGLLGNMISAQDTVLPGYTQRPSPGEGTFLTNMPLTTPEGVTDVIGLLRDGRPLLLLLGDGASRHRAAVRPWEPAVRVVEPARPEPAPAYDAVLVRPDGYVAWSASSGGGGGLGAALSRYFGAGRGTGPGTGSSGRAPRIS
ncbi:FAD-dependent monooxygenase [Streptomyces yangpuensis]|uniref:FAD-dependent monooxygenase n=1 Tax=Streptomyces yangpuensis TaxID=1648182 RepID=UPI00381EB032